jgi:hypothetical protein
MTLKHLQPIVSGSFVGTVQEQFVQVVVCCNIGNGHGVSWAAATSFEQIIRSFSPREISTMIRLAATAETTLGRRCASLLSCRERFKQTIALIDPASVPSGVKAQYDHFLM